MIVDRIAQQSAAVELTCTESLRLAVLAVDLARRTHNSIAAVDPEVFAASASAELREHANVYKKIFELGLTDDLVDSDPALIRKAVEILEITP